MKCSRVPGRRKSRFAQTPVAPASRAALTTSRELLGSVGDARQDRRHPDARLDPGVDELLQRPQPLARVCGRGLGLSPHVLVERRDREGDADRRVARGFCEHVDVADDHRASRDDRERVVGFAERLDAGAGQPVAPLGRLVRVGRGPDRYQLGVPRRSRELRAEHLGDVDLHPDRGAVAFVDGRSARCSKART